MIKSWEYKNEYNYLKKKILASIDKTLKSGKLFFGNELNKFEKNFLKINKSKYGVAVASGTDAIYLSLKALNIGQNDEVITVANTAIPTVSAIKNTGASVKFIDIKEDYLMNVNEIEKVITKKTKAIIPVHLYGQSCEMDKIIKIAKKYKIKVIEDCAQAQGATFKKKKVGNFGIAGCFSFYPTKILGAYGDGGFVTTNNKKIAKKVSLQRLHGINGDAWKRYERNNDWYYEVIDLGYKYNTTDIQSAMGIVQLEKLEWMRDERKMIAEKYKNAFSGKLDFIEENIKNESSWHLFVIKIGNRDELHQKLKEKGISTSVHFIPIHKHPYYKNRFSFDNEKYPVANLVFEQSLSLPIYPGLGESEVEYIIKYVLEYAEDTNK